MVDYRISAEERTRFKRCRRQWDFASPHRRNLRSTDFVEPALPAALKDALAGTCFEFGEGTFKQRRRA